MRAPLWSFGDLVKRHVYFVRHLALCDRAKRELVRRKIFNIGTHLVKEAHIRYEAPLQWHEALTIKIFLLGLLRKNRIAHLKYEIFSVRRNQKAAEAYLAYVPDPSRRELFLEELPATAHLREELKGWMSEKLP